MYTLIARMDNDFYDLPRKEQILMLLTNMEGLKVTQTSIADVMDVSNGLVTSSVSMRTTRMRSSK